MSRARESPESAGDPFNKDKREVFDDLARAFEFETTETRRKARFRRDELAEIYDRLHALGYISDPREEEDPRTDIRRGISASLGFEDRGGSALTKGHMRELAHVFAAAGVVEFETEPLPDPTTEDGVLPPTEEDYQKAKDAGLVYEWNDVEECICVSTNQNSTRYHSLWTVRNGTLLPACRGYTPSKSSGHRLAPEESIGRLVPECDYCKNGNTRT